MLNTHIFKPDDGPCFAKKIRFEDFELKCKKILCSYIQSVPSILIYDTKQLLQYLRCWPYK